MPWQPMHLLLNSIPGQKWIYHGLEFTMTLPALLKDISTSLLLKVSQSGPKYTNAKTQLQKLQWNFYMYRSPDSGVVDTLVSNNGSQLTSGEFRDFYETYLIEHIKISLDHSRSNGQAERFVDTLKRDLKKARATPNEKALQQFLQVYRITPNNKTPASQSPAKVMFVYKIWSIFDKLLMKQMKPGRTCIVPPKRYNSGDSLFQNLQRQQIFLGDGNNRKKELGTWYIL